MHKYSTYKFFTPPYPTNCFGVLKFPIGFALQITWTVECYDPTSSPEKWCSPPVLGRRNTRKVCWTRQLASWTTSRGSARTSSSPRQAGVLAAGVHTLRYLGTIGGSPPTGLHFGPKNVLEITIQSKCLKFKVASKFAEFKIAHLVDE